MADQVFIAVTSYRVMDTSQIADVWTYEGVLYVRYAITGIVTDVERNQQRPLLHYLADKSQSIDTERVINDMMVALGWKELDEDRPKTKYMPDVAVK